MNRFDELARKRAALLLIACVFAITALVYQWPPRAMFPMLPAAPALAVAETVRPLPPIAIAPAVPIVRRLVQNPVVPPPAGRRPEDDNVAAVTTAQVPPSAGPIEEAVALSELLPSRTLALDVTAPAVITATRTRPSTPGALSRAFVVTGTQIASAFKQAGNAFKLGF